MAPKNPAARATGFSFSLRVLAQFNSVARQRDHSVGIDRTAHVDEETEVGRLARSNQSDVGDGFESHAIGIGARLEVNGAHAAKNGAIGRGERDALRVEMRFEKNAVFLALAGRAL